MRPLDTTSDAMMTRVWAGHRGVVGARRIELLTSSTSTQHASHPPPRASPFPTASPQGSIVAKHGVVVQCRAARSIAADNLLTARAEDHRPTLPSEVPGLIGDSGPLALRTIYPLFATSSRLPSRTVAGDVAVCDKVRVGTDGRRKAMRGGRLHVRAFPG